MLIHQYFIMVLYVSLPCLREFFSFNLFKEKYNTKKLLQMRMDGDIGAIPGVLSRYNMHNRASQVMLVVKNSPANAGD